VYDLDKLKERRVTYQDGDCRDPIFLKDSKRIVYASTTDELKESPVIVRERDEKLPYPLTELYISDLSGSDIGRLTSKEGFDGFPWPRWDRPQSITFSRYTDSQLSSYQLNIENKQSVQLLSKKDLSIESLQLSPDKKQWAWIERAKTGTTQVWTGPFQLQSNKQTALSLPIGEYKEVLWLAPQKLILSAKIFKKYFQFYSFDLETKCLQSLFDSNTDLASPRLQVERQGLVFSSSQDGRSDIFYKSISANLTGTCLSQNYKPN
ncbi:MAG: TolB family protein, partial [Pseudobdellovibrionaceae bacterium]